MKKRIAKIRGRDFDGKSNIGTWQKSVEHSLNTLKAAVNELIDADRMK